jgi:DNA-binding LacI/PurR family transcriptional regulator
MASSTPRPARPSVTEHAERLAEVIEEQRLAPGDPFLTTDQAARHLQVRREVANRALQVLVHRGRIERRQRIGSVVAEPPEGEPLLDAVHFVLQEDHLLGRPAASDAAQAGLHSVLPSCSVDLTVVPTTGTGSLLDTFLKESLRKPHPVGLCLVRCDYPTQRRVAESGLPAVVHGTTYAGIELPSVDVDGRGVGRLQAEALLARGCDRVVLLGRDRTLPGDRDVQAGLREALAAAGRGTDGLEVLGLAPYPEVIRAELALLFRRPGRLGVVCATRELADAAWAAAQDSGRLGADLWIHSNSLGADAPPPPFPCAVPSEDLHAQGAALGRLLAARFLAPDRPVEHRRIPCRLIEPGGAA